jgi:lysophospholipase L1-like esterase
MPAQPSSSAVTAGPGPEAPPPVAPRISGPRLVGLWLVALAGFLAAAECAARLDDAVFHGVPFLANPSYDDLFVRDALGRRGRPNAQFGKWQLNSFGFRGPQLTLTPAPGCTRIAIMGASETFGYFESPGHEFPALLGQRLAGHGCVEVVNVAVVGMTTGTMIGYWNNWVAHFRPDVVVVYSSPLFYLLSDDSKHGTVAPAPAAPAASLAAPAPLPEHPFTSRFVKRIRGVGHAAVPRWVWMALAKRQIAQTLQGIPQDARIHAPPAAGLAAYEHDLVRLVAALRAGGARVVLVTHAQRALLPVTARAEPDLWDERSWVPQADLPVFIQFDRAANAVTLEVAARERVQAIDAATALNGCWECFADLNHFSDQGAQRMAGLLAGQLPVPGKPQ